jgi:hypothetical protein
MPLPREEVDASTPKFLRDKYAVVGVGETTYTRGSNMTTRALATIAVRNAMLDAGLKASEIDGMLSYQSNDSVFSPSVAGDLGIRLNFYMDVFGGGSSTEALIGIAIGVIEAGMCKSTLDRWMPSASAASRMDMPSLSAATTRARSASTISVRVHTATPSRTS